MQRPNNMPHINSDRHGDHERALLPCHSVEDSKVFKPTSKVSSLHNADNHQPYLITPGASTISQGYATEPSHLQTCENVPISRSSSEEIGYHPFKQSLHQSDPRQDVRGSHDYNRYHNSGTLLPSILDHPNRRINEPSSPGAAGADYYPKEDQYYLRSPSQSGHVEGSHTTLPLLRYRLPLQRHASLQYGPPGIDASSEPILERGPANYEHEHPERQHEMKRSYVEQNVPRNSSMTSVDRNEKVSHIKKSIINTVHK